MSEEDYYVSSIKDNLQESSQKVKYVGGFDQTGDDSGLIRSNEILNIVKVKLVGFLTDKSKVKIQGGLELGSNVLT